MSLKIEYRCDLCGDLKDKSEIMAVIFSATNKPFYLAASGDAGFRDHQGRHICNSCAGHIQLIYK